MGWLTQLYAAKASVGVDYDLCHIGQVDTSCNYAPSRLTLRRRLEVGEMLDKRPVSDNLKAP
jgi:hypothetical protein